MNNELIDQSVARSLRYDEIKTDATEQAVEVLGEHPVIWDRTRGFWHHALTAEAWAVVIALHDAGLRIVPAESGRTI